MTHETSQADVAASDIFVQVAMRFEFALGVIYLRTCVSEAAAEAPIRLGKRLT